SDHAGCLDSRKSTSGGIQFLGGDKLVSCSSKKQDCTSMSSAKAEYMSLSACCVQVLWMRTQLTDYGFHFDKYLCIMTQRQPQPSRAILSSIRVPSTLTFDITSSKKVEKGIVKLFFVGTKYQLADLFTKALPIERFRYLVRRLDTMANMTAHTGQPPTMAPPIRTNNQILPRIRWVQTGYLKFSVKGTKREVFRMPIPGSLITTDLQEASYYQEYLENMVKHRWFLGGKPAKKPNPTIQKVWINILQYLIHLRMCKDVPTKMMKMFLLVENLRQQNPDNREVLHQRQILFKIYATSVRKYGCSTVNGNFIKPM
nr:retrovirus-related Pol polyprotein from transposon TNT 1-94 [Tanacetum cinerariifolium]